MLKQDYLKKHIRLEKIMKLFLQQMFLNVERSRAP